MISKSYAKFLCWLVFGMLFTVYGWIMFIDVIFQLNLVRYLQWWEMILALATALAGALTFGPILIWDSWKYYTKQEDEEHE